MIATSDNKNEQSKIVTKTDLKNIASNIFKNYTYLHALTLLYCILPLLCLLSLIVLFTICSHCYLIFFNEAVIIISCYDFMLSFLSKHLFSFLWFYFYYYNFFAIIFWYHFLHFRFYNIFCDRGRLVYH